MRLEEVIKTKEYFKRRDWEFWCRVQDGNIVDKRGKIVHLKVEDILATDWVVSSLLYDLELKKKYPNGILCLASCEGIYWYKEVIINYRSGTDFPFITHRISAYKYVKPIPNDEIPFILTEDRCNEGKLKELFTPDI